MPMLGIRVGHPRQQNAGVKEPASLKSLHRGRGARRRPLGRASGFTLIEVMVALVVLVLGVLGAAAMTLSAIRDTKQSGLRSQASALAYELSDLMRMSPGQESVFTGAAPASGVPACWSTGCSATDMATNNYYEWLGKLKGTSGMPGSGLPNGAAVICRDVGSLASDAASYAAACDGLPTSPLVVKMKWDEKNNNARDATAPTAVTTTYLVVPIQPY